MPLAALPQAPPPLARVFFLTCSMLPAVWPACLPACLPVQEGSSSDAGHFGATAAAMPYLQGGTALSQAVSERLNDTG